MRPRLTRALCTVAVLGSAASLAGVLAGGTVFRWEMVIWLSALLLAWGWFIPSAARAARSWEGAAGTWKELAVGWQARYEDLHGDSMRLLTAARKDGEL